MDFETMGKYNIGQYSTNLLGERAVSIIEDHILYSRSDPFFLMFAPIAVHAPWQVSTVQDNP